MIFDEFSDDGVHAGRSKDRVPIRRSTWFDASCKNRWVTITAYERSGIHHSVNIEPHLMRRIQQDADLLLFATLQRMTLHNIRYNDTKSKPTTSTRSATSAYSHSPLSHSYNQVYHGYILTSWLYPTTKTSHNLSLFLQLKRNWTTQRNKNHIIPRLSTEKLLQ